MWSRKLMPLKWCCRAVSKSQIACLFTHTHKSSPYSPQILSQFAKICIHLRKLNKVWLSLRNLCFQRIQIGLLVWKGSNWQFLSIRRPEKAQEWLNEVQGMKLKGIFNNIRNRNDHEPFHEKLTELGFILVHKGLAQIFRELIIL